MRLGQAAKRANKFVNNSAIENQDFSAKPRYNGLEDAMTLKGHEMFNLPPRSGSVLPTLLPRVPFAIPSVNAFNLCSAC